MAETTQGAALLLNANGNVDRVRTTDGQIFRIESTISMEAAEEAKTAASNCNTATKIAEAAEKTRASNENARKTAEAKRVSAEKQRHDEHIADQQSSSNAAAAASGAASRADAAASQALQVANSVAQGSAGSSDMAALKRQNAQLFQRLSNLTGEFIYSDGTVYCPSSKATASGDTITFARSCTASGVTLTLS